MKKWLCILSALLLAGCMQVNGNLKVTKRGEVFISLQALCQEGILNKEVPGWMTLLEEQMQRYSEDANLKVLDKQVDGVNYRGFECSSYYNSIADFTNRGRHEGSANADLDALKHTIVKDIGIQKRNSLLYKYITVKLDIQSIPKELNVVDSKVIFSLELPASIYKMSDSPVIQLKGDNTVILDLKGVTSDETLTFITRYLDITVLAYYIGGCIVFVLLLKWCRNLHNHYLGWKKGKSGGKKKNVMINDDDFDFGGGSF